MTAHKYVFPLVLVPGVVVLFATIGFFVIQYDTARTIPSLLSSENRSAILVTEHVSASTNTPEITLVIYQNGSASLTGSKALPEGSVTVQALQSELNHLEDIPNTLTTQCAKSTSFGTKTTITYQGKTSSDISCRSLHESTYAKLLLDFDTIQAKFTSGT